jgi:hypothetical protein
MLRGRAPVERRPLLRGVGPETPMETKSRFKVTAGRDPGLPLSDISVERASPPRLSSPGLHTALGTQISNRLGVGMLHVKATVLKLPSLS